MADEQVQQARRGPGRPRQEHVTKAVLEAVVELVAEEGMGALTMDAVATRAGVSKPAMYRRWPTKQDLIIAAAESRVGTLTVPDMGDFRAELRAVLMERVRAYRQPGVGRLLAGVISAAAEAGAGREAFRAYVTRVTSETRHLLERGIARGDVRPDVPIVDVTTLIASSLVFRLVAEQRAPEKELVDSVVDLIGRAVDVRP
ncbi:TetR/AcrR family transcriptional regulator [Streptomyces endophyticus]|uniref:TetR/AcrR family transcriptional regulator n=1 Tax=Streptomyces endophyticus TaxID=714166 RepID=A0ABU6F711_9ACTN|nr:TetR/AcrR family transcriptional regulator [Streptomyces endophyticus]MEB8339150.1 TetR/AcrR family transcriptional regulator [Streptomyces endophyticus]